MSVYKDRGHWRYAKKLMFPNGQKQRITGTPPINTKVAAEAALRAHIERVLHGDATTGKEVPTVAGFEKEFMSYAEANNKPSEVATKRSIMEHHIVPALGKLRLDKIGEREIEVYKAGRLAGGLAKKTVNNHLTVLRRMLVLAKRWKLIDAVPDLLWLKAPRPDFDFLDFDEAERLAAVADGEWKAMVTVALRTGMRIGELLALRWDDVDLVAGLAVVRRSVARGIVGTPKSGRSREIPLSGEALAALKAHRHLRGELVFPDMDGEMLDKGGCKWALWRACKRAGLRRIGWKVFRHTFASHLVMRGVPLKAVQELLGHATIEMTMRYAHLSPDVNRSAVQLLDRAHRVLTGTLSDSQVQENKAEN